MSTTALTADPHIPPCYQPGAFDAERDLAELAEMREKYGPDFAMAKRRGKRIPLEPIE